jgi:hypothetical protein
MAKSPGDRFPTCTDFASTLSEAVRGRPIIPQAAAAVMRWRNPTPTPETISISETPATPSSSRTNRRRRPSDLLGTRVLLGAVGVGILVGAVVLAIGRGGSGGAPSTPPASAGQPTSASPAARPGTILLSDDFDDPSRAVLPTTSSNPAFRLGYLGGEYEIAGHAGSVFLPDTYHDATLSVDARLVGDATGRSISIACRAGSQGWYIATLYPDSGRFDLDKVTGSSAHTSLIPEKQAPAILAGNTRNHIDLTCSGDTIEIAINGTTVGSVRDSTYTEGWFMIFTSAGQQDEAEEAVLRLDNLVVRQR